MRQVRRRWWLLAVVGLLSVAAGAALHHEIDGSALQSIYLSRLAGRLGFELRPGPSDTILFPPGGPYDDMLGYSGMPASLDRLALHGYRITAQARLSDRHAELIRRGLNPIYHEKAQTGLSIKDRRGRAMFSSQYPQLIYGGFGEIPPVVVKTLLLIENRDLLDERYPYRNPVIVWERLGRAVLDLLISRVIEGHDVPGASTLATQIEKYRHSPEGRTSGVMEKVRQMRSATLRAYQDGRNTMGARRRIVTDYINSVPLGAMAGLGEIRGVGQGLATWFGTPFQEANALLRDLRPGLSPEALGEAARVYKQVLALFLAQRRPAYYLMQNRAALAELLDRHLTLLEAGGVLEPTVRTAVTMAPLIFKPRGGLFQTERLNFLERKGANAVRVHLMSQLGLKQLYSLDRMDAEVVSTLDMEAQGAVTDLLTRLRDAEFAREAGLMDERLLAHGDPAKVIYSFTLRERVGNVNLLRVQADNVEGPFNVNEGGKLELGSTAKVRTLVSYLQTIETLWRQHLAGPVQGAGADAGTDAAGAEAADPLTVWVRGRIRERPGIGLAELLDAAMERTYSASPHEVFFTGGGQHRFSNFDPLDDRRTVTVREALRKSVNLPFVRMMRDIVFYHRARIPEARRILSDPASPQRRAYLLRFAHQEGRNFLGQFYLKYRGLTPDEVILRLARRARQQPRRQAVIFNTVRPEAACGDFRAFLSLVNPQGGVTEAVACRALAAAGRLGDDLHDRAYIAGIHPLELWLGAYLYRVPGAKFSEIVTRSEAAREAAYQWLLSSRTKARQDLRIQIMFEEQAFKAIHAQWAGLGFPFESLVPTLATALGSSGDRPAALAELMGIIRSGGMRLPSVRISALRLAQATPYETHLVSAPRAGTRVLSEELSGVVAAALRGVVEGGTAVRVKGAFVDQTGEPLPVGGKTGTGDNRYSVFAPGGRVIESVARSRTATFVFYLGDRFFGTLTAYVPDASAGDYSFTSALPVQILKILAPRLLPLLNESRADLVLPVAAEAPAPGGPE